MMADEKERLSMHIVSIPPLKLQKMIISVYLLQYIEHVTNSFLKREFFKRVNA